MRWWKEKSRSGKAIWIGGGTCCILLMSIVMVCYWSSTHVEFWYKLRDPVSGEFIELDVDPIWKGETYKVFPYIEFRDFRNNWSDRIVYRETWVYDEKHSLRYTEHGPMIKTKISNKPHGEWEHVPLSDKGLVTFTWYWYGEEISESEWHKLNR